MKEFDALKLENQLCFPLYAVSKEIIKKYRPYLDKVNLTYTQYITMMVLWEHKEINLTKLGEKLHLDSGTLTPVVKSLEAKGLIKKTRLQTDERVVNVALTEEGLKLKEKAKNIPAQITGCFNLSLDEASQLYTILQKLLKSI